MRAPPLLALSLLALSAPAAGATLDGAPAVRANLEGEEFVAARTAAPRRIRYSLDDAENSFVSNATDGAHATSGGSQPVVLPALSRRVFRVSLDQDQPAFTSRLIRLSLDEGRPVYGRLGESTILARRWRSTLD